MKPSKSIDQRADEQRELERAERFPPWEKLDLSGFMTRDWPEQRFAIDPIFPKSEVTLLVGNGKSGKSFLLLAMAACIAVGAAWGPFRTIQGPAVFLSFEDKQKTLAWRLRWICQAHGLDPAAVEAGLTVIDAHKGETALAAEYMDEVSRTRVLAPTPRLDELRERCKGASFIVIDSASETFDGNENERRQVRRFVQFLVAIAEAEDAALVLSAHVNKVGIQSEDVADFFSGSTAWNNSVRSRLALIVKDTAITLTHASSTHSKSADPVQLARIDRGVLWPQSDEALRAIANMRGADDDALVLAGVRAALAQGRSVTTGRSNAANAWQTLREFSELGDELRAKNGRLRVFDALTRIERSGEIRRLRYQTTRGNYAERYELTQGSIELTTTACVGGGDMSCVKTPIPPSNELTTGTVRPLGGLATHDELTTNLRTHEADQAPKPSSGEEKPSSDIAASRNEVSGHRVRKVPL